MNAPDFRSAGFHQVSSKRGKIGHPVPGMSVRIVDITTGEPVPAGQSGLLLVRGAWRAWWQELKMIFQPAQLRRLRHSHVNVRRQLEQLRAEYLARPPERNAVLTIQ